LKPIAELALAGLRLRVWRTARRLRVWRFGVKRGGVRCGAVRLRHYRRAEFVADLRFVSGVAQVVVEVAPTGVIVGEE
jgi:hypothetical protein